MFAMEFHQITALDTLDRFRIAILRPALEMTFEQNLIKDHGSHVCSIFDTDGEAC